MNAPMTFSWSSTEREKQSVLRVQPFDSGSQRQVIALNALSKNLAGQVLFFRKLPSIAPPLISGQHSDIKGCEQCQQFTTGFIGTWTKSVGQYAPVFVLYAYQSLGCCALLPTKLHCSSSSQISATSAWATGDDVLVVVRVF